MGKRKTPQKPKYYDVQNFIDEVNDKDVRYYLIYGERSAGKSTSCAKIALRNYVEKHQTTGFARRYDDDWGQNVASTYFEFLVSDGYVSKITNGQWTNVYYFGHKWYLCKWDEEKDKLIKDIEPFAYAFSLNTWEKSKGGQFPTLHTLIMEEFITNTRYLGAENSEFSFYSNLVSTLARDKEDFTNILVGNTIRRYGNPYFICMGIEKKVLEMQPGDRIVFKTEGKKLKIACEYTDPPADGKKSDILFDFPTDNTVSRQITSGEWQIDEHYPTLPLGTRIKPMDIIFSYFLLYRDNILQADVILQDNKYYTYFHRKTTELKDVENDLIFDLEYHLEPNYRRDIMHPTDNIGMKVLEHFKRESVYVQDVQVGEILYSYIQSL